MGLTFGETISDDIGLAVGEPVGTIENIVGITIIEDIADDVLLAVGEPVGDPLGLVMGITVGETMGDDGGLAVGEPVGDTVGLVMGIKVGETVGEKRRTSSGRAGEIISDDVGISPRQPSGVTEQ